MSRSFLESMCGSVLCAALAALWIPNIASATPIYLEAGGVVVGEGELFSRRTAALDGTAWKIAPTEVSNPSDNAQPNSSARGGRYVQLLPDTNLTGAGPLNAPSIEYDVFITTAGTYRLYVRWEGNSSAFLNSDSLFADIVQLKDGSAPAFGTGTNLIADWYELFQPLDADFSTLSWDGQGGPEENGPTPSDSNMTWVISTPGLYTLRFSKREDGAAIDAWVLQLGALAAPSGVGPPASSIVPESGTASLVFAGLLGLGIWGATGQPAPRRVLRHTSRR
jgi:hypothetical protein